MSLYSHRLVRKGSYSKPCTTRNDISSQYAVEIQGCQFSDLSLISDFLRIKETGIKLIKYSKNMYKILKVFKDRLDSGKRLDNPSLKTVSNH